MKTKHAVASRKRKKKVLKQAKGYWGDRSRKYRRAAETLRRAGVYSYRDRRAKKREFRSLWITRISAACKAHGVSYSTFMNGLRKKKSAIDRKMLADIAVHDKTGFGKLVETAKSASESKG